MADQSQMCLIDSRIRHNFGIHFAFYLFVVFVKVDSNTGVVTVRTTGVLDGSAYSQLSFTVTCSDNGSPARSVAAAKIVLIGLSRVNSNGPVLTPSAVYSFPVAECKTNHIGTAVTRISPVSYEYAVPILPSSRVYLFVLHPLRKFSIGYLIECLL